MSCKRFIKKQVPGPLQKVAEYRTCEAATLHSVSSESTSVNMASTEVSPASLQQSLFYRSVLQYCHLQPPISSDNHSVYKPDTAHLKGRQFHIGEVLEHRYQVLAIITWGGNSTLYRVLDTEVSRGDRPRTYVLKIGRLSQAIQQLTRLRHSGMVRIRKILQGSVVGVLMEELDGEVLSDTISRHPDGLPQQEAFRIIRKLLHVIAFLHQHHIVHGDIKPGNVFLCRSGETKLLDFDCTQQGSLNKGSWEWDLPVALTPAFASCSLLSGQPLMPQDDYYSMGCLFYMLLTGRHPFNYRTALSARALASEPAKIKTLNVTQWQALLQLLEYDTEQERFSLADFEMAFFAMRCSVLEAVS